MKIRNGRLTLTMALIVAAAAGARWQPADLAAAAIRHARADDAPATETTVEQYCRNWARNGIMGAKVHNRNGPRKITYIDENDLRYLLKHQVAGDNLYLLKGDYTPEETRYLEESLLAGYDRMGQWVREHGTEAPDFTAWEESWFGACMTKVPEAIQALRAKR